MDVLVTGATGFVGRHVADELARAGHSVRCLVRPATDPAELVRAGHRIVRGEVLDQASLAAAAEGTGAVVHVAGLIAARSFREMSRVNVEGVARIAAAAARARARRFVLVSSLAAAGPSRNGRAVRETDPAQPVSRYGLSKLLGERAAERALAATVPLTVVRPPAVYGPHDRGIHGFFDAAARGVRLRIGSRPRRVSIVHGEDLARAIRLALETESAAGRTYFVANTESYDIDDLIARIASAVGGRTRTVRLPDPVVRAAGALAEEVARWRGAVPLFSRDKVREFLATGWVCDSSRAAAELGWQPRWTLDLGLAQTAAWYRERGLGPGPYNPRMRRATIAAAFSALLATAAGAGESTSSWIEWTRRRAAQLEARGEYEDALEEWSVLAHLEPESVEPLSRAAVLCVEVPVLRGKELTPGSPMFLSAERFVSAGIRRGGQFDAGLAYAGGRVHLANSRWGPAWRMLTDAKNWGFDPVRSRFWQYRAAVNRGAMLVDEGRANEAMEDLQRLLTELPGHPDEHFLLIDLAAANHQMQQPEEAKKILDRVLAADPGAADARYLLGVVLADQGQLEDAAKTFEETLLHATATYADRTYRNTLLRLTDVQIKLGRIEPAEATVNRLLEVAKDDPEALFAKGRVCQAKNDLEGALRHFRRVARLNPESTQTLTNLKQVLHLLGLDSEADEVGRRIEAIDRKRAAEIEGDFPEAAGGGR